MASRKVTPKRTINLEAYREHIQSRKTTFTRYEDAEKPPQPHIHWKINESAMYVGAPKKHIRQQHGKSVILILRVISNFEIEILIDGVSMIVHPSEIRPLDYIEE